MASNSNVEDAQSQQNQSSANATIAKDVDVEQVLSHAVISQPTEVEKTLDASPHGLHLPSPNPSNPPWPPAVSVHNSGKLEPSPINLPSQLEDNPSQGRYEAQAAVPPLQHTSHQDQDPVADITTGKDPAPKPPQQDTNTQQNELPHNLDQFLPFWRAYNDDAEAQDKEIVEILGSNLDGLLIFAGLFSASNVAFIVEAYKDLKEDQAETTNELLRVLIHNQVHANDPISLISTSFTASTHKTRVNALFFASLCCSLFTAFGAVLGKQWLNHYKREGRRMMPAHRARERQRKFMGLDFWRLEQVVEMLPILLQISLFFFFAALVEFIWLLNATVAGVITSFAIISVCFFIITTAIAVLSPSSPFQTRFSALIGDGCKFAHGCLRFLSRQILSALNLFHDNMSTLDESYRTVSKKEEKEQLSLECISWIITTSSDDRTLSLAYTAALMLPVEVWSTAKELRHRAPTALRLVLGAKVSDRDSTVFLNVSVEQLKGILESIFTLVTRWDKENDLVIPEFPNNDAFIVALESLLWRTLRGYPGDKDDATWIWRTLRTLGFQVEPMPQDIDIFYRNAVRNLEPSEHLPVVLGSAILLERGMDFWSMRTLLKLPPDMKESEFERILNLLQDFLIVKKSRFYGLVHNSARLFLTDRSRCKDQRFQVDPISTHTDLALKCIMHMKAFLKPNMFGSASLGPIVLNTDVPHLKQILDSEIPQSLEYAYSP
ncbi:hypothetical protein FRC03_005946 [Tulasnella sp. 419]|nr:hypothetical protein FRC03_005946 [Tulasnella sp. 419]